MYLYVMGRGHSGSTILGILLGGGAAIASVGEVVSGLGRYPLGTEICSCGTPMHECSFWAEVRRRFEGEGHSWAEFVRRVRAETDVRRWLPTCLARPDDAVRLQLATMMQAFARAIAATAGKPHVLDTNKETTRGLFLLKYLPEARVIHLVRDPRGIIQSHYWRAVGGHGFRFMRRHHRATSTWPLFLVLAACSWTIGNTLCELARRYAPDRVIRLRYEDLCEDPVGAVRAIEAAFGVPVADVVTRLEQGEAFAVGHNVGGNHIRHEREIRFDPTTERTRPLLPRWAMLATLALCWPLMCRYGYSITETGIRSGNLRRLFARPNVPAAAALQDKADLDRAEPQRAGHKLACLWPSKSGMQMPAIAQASRWELGYGRREARAQKRTATSDQTRGPSG